MCLALEEGEKDYLPWNPRDEEENVRSETARQDKTGRHDEKKKRRKVGD